MFYKDAEVLNSEMFKAFLGITKKCFNEALKIINEAKKEKMKFGGKPNKLSNADQLIMKLLYYRDNISFKRLGIMYGLKDSGVFKNITWIEEVLKNSDFCKLPGLDLQFASGNIHDKKVFEESNVLIKNDIKVLVDKGYIGLPLNFIVPKKEYKKNPLTDQDKINNYRIGSKRIAIEHVNASLKIFDCIKSQFRRSYESLQRSILIIASYYNSYISA